MILALMMLLAADAPPVKEDPRIAVARALIAVREAERDEEAAKVAYLEAGNRKARAAAAFEAAKRLLPGFREGALIDENFSIKAEEKKK